MLGLAAGIGLVVTVSGVAKAESKVLGALYGAGTDVPPPGGHVVSDMASTHLGITEASRRAATRPTSTFPCLGPSPCQ
jgi:hypothetical protein